MSALSLLTTSTDATQSGSLKVFLPVVTAFSKVLPPKRGAASTWCNMGSVQESLAPTAIGVTPAFLSLALIAVNSAQVFGGVRAYLAKMSLL